MLRRAIVDAGPAEICGFVLRHPMRGTYFMRVANWSECPGTFSVANSEVERCRRHAAREGSEIVAFLHSQNATVLPSEVDKAYRTLSDIPWVIVRLAGDKLETHWF